MKQAKILEGKPATKQSIGLGKVTASSSCSCCGEGALISLGRNKIMSEVKETHQEVTTVTAPEIVCGGCASAIEKALGQVAGITKVEVDIAAKQVTVNHSANVSRRTIVDTLDQAGYEVAE